MSRAILFLFILSLTACGRGKSADRSPKPDTLGDRKGAASDEAGIRRRGDIAEGKAVICPVCGLEFRSKESVGTVQISEKTYYFLLEDHREAFRADPGAFLTHVDEPNGGS